ncbi:methyl-accepting chemotaxis protein [Agrobacterium vitis]|uniref:methyl-accepting chemotaxis protein n=1 Tax=Agrobacterium vitis TaxID=373 RepID=UPI001F1BD9DE|nr:methyl-accepting chemotaxis protein [Agrobacterium vitis]
MARPSIKTALPSLVILAGILFLAFSTFAVGQISAINFNVGSIATNWLPSVSSAKEMNVALGDLRLAYRNYIMAQSEDQLQKADGAITAAIADFRKQADLYRGLPMTPTEEALIGRVIDVFDGYVVTGSGITGSFKSRGLLASINAVSTELGPVGDRIAEDLDALVDFNTKGAQDAYTASQASYSWTVQTSYIAIGVSVLIMGVIVYFAYFCVARPIEIITGSIANLAAGQTGRAIPFAGRKDEIGSIAEAVETFRKAAIEKGRLEEAAARDRAQAEAERDRMKAETEAAANVRLAEATSGIADGLRRLADGDLSFQITEPFAAEFETLRNDLNSAVMRLGKTVESVAHTTHALDGGTREIAQSADDLSKRTEQQAASLEETAAALDQITANLTNSSKRAEEAREAAAHATVSAKHSATVVANAVNAMGRIEASANQIASIIGVIDEIAFQTNLLALNAGVEAARAGEAGKGFAVVAQEVRELAQRSAQAAKEIKELIRGSSSEVESGVRLVRDTGEALKSIESAISNVNDHMISIATSAREQAVGLNEVNTAINQMDQVTQQNAAMVEETNASSATLVAEASRLREIVSGFQLAGAGTSTTHVQRLRQAANMMARSPSVTPARARRDGSGAKSSGWAEY